MSEIQKIQKDESMRIESDVLNTITQDDDVYKENPNLNDYVSTFMRHDYTKPCIYAIILLFSAFVVSFHFNISLITKLTGSLLGYLLVIYPIFIATETVRKYRRIFVIRPDKIISTSKFNNLEEKEIKSDDIEDIEITDNVKIYSDDNEIEIPFDTEGLSIQKKLFINN